jgi:hypothetical protein
MERLAPIVMTELGSNSCCQAPLIISVGSLARGRSPMTTFSLLQQVKIGRAWLRILATDGRVIPQIT